MGFDPSITVVAGICATLWSVVGHTQCVGKLGYLDKVFNTPSTHRVHHGINPEYIDKNYGNLFIFWDRIFGTYAEEKVPEVFGLVKNIVTNNPITITFYTWREMLKDIKQAQSLGEVLGYCVGPPDWQPNRVKLDK
ncbi:MAG: sterol desaturase/sphingolipid hydroxylase (fatty acid hydroxylase superfamily) [Pseudomonadales bacterium]